LGTGVAVRGGGRTLVGSVPALGACGVGLRGQVRQRGGAEQGAGRERGAERGAGAGGHLHGEDRVAPQGAEEVVVPSDAWHAEDLGPDAGQHPLGVGARGLEAGVGRPRRAGVGQRTPVGLAAGQSRQPVQCDEDRRHHVLRQVPGETVAQPGGVGFSAVLGHHIADEPAPPSAVLLDGDRRVPHTGARDQRVLHLGGLHPVAMDLHLPVGAAQEVEVPVGPAPDQVPGAVEPLTGGAAGVGHEGERGRARPAVVAARQPRPSDVQLPGAARGHGPQGRVQDVDGGAGDGGPDRHGRRAVDHLLVQEQDTGVHRGLGRAVGVDHRAARRDGGQQFPAVLGEPALRPDGQQAHRRDERAARDGLPGQQLGERGHQLHGGAPTARH
jgi:hypothetical protein